MALTKTERRSRIKLRIRKKIKGTSSCPRIAVFRSNNEIYAQIINDEAGKTIVAASSLELGKSAGNKTEKAVQVGKSLAEKAKAAQIEKVVFDRGGYLYHGRVKALAEGAREGGLKF